MVRALSSITPGQAQTIIQAIQADSRIWEVQTIDDYDGYLSILVEPNVSGNKQKAFFVSGTAQHLELFETYDDDLTSVASFNDIEDLSARLMHLITQQ